MLLLMCWHFLFAGWGPWILKWRRTRWMAGQEERLMEKEMIWRICAECIRACWIRKREEEDGEMLIFYDLSHNLVMWISIALAEWKQQQKNDSVDPHRKLSSLVVRYCYFYTTRSKQPSTTHICINVPSTKHLHQLRHQWLTKIAVIIPMLFIWCPQSHRLNSSSSCSLCRLVTLFAHVLCPTITSSSLLFLNYLIHRLS